MIQISILKGNLMTTSLTSPNTRLMPLTASTSPEGHLTIGGCDSTELAKRFGTPLWVIDYETILQSVQSVQSGLSGYPGAQVLYAGKAFLNLAMCHIVRRLGIGLDVVSEGELYTALKADLPAQEIFLHGNNKSDAELKLAIENGVKIVANGFFELTRIIELSAALKIEAQILIRVTPGVEPDTHHHIKTGQVDSKFGIALEQVEEFVSKAQSPGVKFLGLHAHIGSQAHEIGPFLESVQILADLCLELKRKAGVEIEMLDVGGGLGIAYTRADKPLALVEWSQRISDKVQKCFDERSLKRPKLFVEPGRSIVGPAGTTLYRAGDVKPLSHGGRYVALDGGMADNPRPVTYNAKYTAALANRMNAPAPEALTTLVGRYCESGDIIIEDAGIAAETGDLVAVFGTGAYNYSMASNYNRTGRPACVLVYNGNAEVILERETCEDLLKQDRVPKWLLGP